MDGICELCGKHALILRSHVLPAFLFKWLKQAGHIRYSETPNRRSQDGVKKDWLCRECEDLFNSFETPFATQVFHPYDVNRNLRVRYGEWMLKFCVSVSWRSLLYLKQEQHFSRFNERRVALIDDALQTWSRFLRGDYKHTGAFEVHLLSFVEIDATGGVRLPPNINRYLTRTIEINAGASDSICFAFSKLGPFAVLGFVELIHPQQWKGTKILHGGGWFDAGRFAVPSQMGDYLIERASRNRATMEKMSPAQQRKIAESIRADPDRFVRSGLFRAMQRDIEMFGDEAFAKYNVTDEEED
jgi:hypothetical protein